MPLFESSFARDTCAVRFLHFSFCSLVPLFQPSELSNFPTSWDANTFPTGVQYIPTNSPPPRGFPMPWQLLMELLHNFTCSRTETNIGRDKWETNLVQIIPLAHGNLGK
eukprot:scaffold18668_cov164-Amphora_coffeaeformis.AAC.4